MCLENNVILTEEQKKTFSNKVEKYVKERGGSYIDAVISLCEEYEIEPPIVAKSLSKPVIEKIQMEGQDLNLLPKPNNILPI
tara:strand:- start:40 stop:285 length:246 start_codon:yes stop_codon:yes gene_type:complete